MRNRGAGREKTRLLQGFKTPASGRAYLCFVVQCLLFFPASRIGRSEFFKWVGRSYIYFGGFLTYGVKTSGVNMNNCPVKTLGVNINNCSRKLKNEAHGT